MRFKVLWHLSAITLVMWVSPSNENLSVTVKPRPRPSPLIWAPVMSWIGLAFRKPDIGVYFAQIGQLI